MRNVSQDDDFLNRLLFAMHERVLLLGNHTGEASRKRVGRAYQELPSVLVVVRCKQTSFLFALRDVDFKHPVFFFAIPSFRFSLRISAIAVLVKLLLLFLDEVGGDHRSL